MAITGAAVPSGTMCSVLAAAGHPVVRAHRVRGARARPESLGKRRKCRLVVRARISIKRLDRDEAEADRHQRGEHVHRPATSHV